MAIVFNEDKKTFSLHTVKTTYQLKIGHLNYINHLYYGATIRDEDLSYLIRRYDRGFSGNPYDSLRERTFSLDAQPQEFTTQQQGDFRINSIEVQNADGSFSFNGRYVSHKMYKGAFTLNGLPAAFARDEDTVDTLELVIEDAVTKVQVTLLYSVFEEANIIMRAARVHNGGQGTIHLKRIMSLNMDCTYTIEGISKIQPGGGVYPEAVYDAENGTFTLSCQELGKFEFQGYHITDQMTAVYYYNGNYYDNAEYMLDPLIFTANLCKDGTVEVVPSNDEYGPLEGLTILGYVEELEDQYLTYNSSTKLPGKLSKGSQEMDPNYAKWLGTWEIDRQAMAFNGTEWVSSGDPVTDKWTIAENSVNESFTITGLYGKGDNLPVVANFDAASGEISVATQDVGPIRFQGDDYDCEAYLFGGLLYSNGSNYRISGNYTIFTAKMSGDNAANLTPGTVTIASLSSDPLALNFARFYAADPKDGKYYTFDDKALATLPNTMRRASTSSTQSMGNAPAVRDGASVMAVSGTNAKNGSLAKINARKRDAKPASARKSGKSFEKALKF